MLRIQWSPSRSRARPCKSRIPSVGGPHEETLEKRAFVSGELSKVDGGDYTTPSKPWDVAQDKENSFILGGVYGSSKPLTALEGGQLYRPVTPKRACCSVPLPTW